MLLRLGVEGQFLFEGNFGRFLLFLVFVWVSKYHCGETASHFSRFFC